MKLVYVRNKENGTTYVYESKYYWNPEKRQSRSRRVCIGKLDGEGNLIPSPRFSRPLPETIAHQGGAAAARPAKRCISGAFTCWTRSADRRASWTTCAPAFRRNTGRFFP